MILEAEAFARTGRKIEKSRRRRILLQDKFYGAI
jgi:hypothetical protein